MPNNRGLANASDDVRKKVASLGGSAPHPKGRGMQNVPEWKRKQIARLGGLARHSQPAKQNTTAQNQNRTEDMRQAA